MCFSHNIFLPCEDGQSADGNTATKPLRLLHTADLHLSQQDAAYGLAVLREMIAVFERTEADGWLFCGDIFDTFADAAHLVGEFARLLAPLQGKALALIAGNHELLRAPGSTDAARREALAKVFAPLTEAGLRWAVSAQVSRFSWPHLPLEVLAVPFQPDLSGLWEDASLADAAVQAAPPAAAPWRVGLFHGALQGLNYTGQSEEEDHAVLDPALFSRLNLHYAALGHIHRPGEMRQAGWLAHQPGSPRVWRRGESGARCVSLLQLAQPAPQLERIPLKAAGRWQQVAAQLEETRLLGAAGETLSAQQFVAQLAEHYDEHHWLEVQLTGLVEAHSQAEEVKHQLEAAAAKRFRRFEVRLDGEALLEAAELHQHPLARAFDVQWRQRLAALMQTTAASGAAGLNLLSVQQLAPGEENSAAEDPALRQLRKWQQARRIFMRTLKDHLH